MKKFELKPKKELKRVVVEIDSELYKRMDLARLKMKLTWKSLIEQLFEMALK